MRTFMFTWNPLQGRPSDFEAFLEQLAQGQAVRDDWSSGNRKDLPVGSRFFLLRQGQEPKGIMAAGYTLSAPQPSERVDDHSLYCDIVFTAVLDTSRGHLLSLEELRHAPLLVNIPWGIPSGGREFSTAEAGQLEALWHSLLSRLGRAEVPHGQEFA